MSGPAEAFETTASQGAGTVARGQPAKCQLPLQRATNFPVVPVGVPARVPELPWFLDVPSFRNATRYVVYPCRLSGNRRSVISPLQDQEYAAALIWVCVTFVYLLPAVVITTQMLSYSRDPSWVSSSQVRPTF
jgi:hypothetical protein